MGWLYTDADDADDDKNNDTWETEHDCIGSLPNEAKTVHGFKATKCSLATPICETLQYHTLEPILHKGLSIHI